MRDIGEHSISFKSCPTEFETYVLFLKGEATLERLSLSCLHSTESIIVEEAQYAMICYYLRHNLDGLLNKQ